MESIINSVTSINWEVIAQLTLVALIMLAGPAVIVVLASRNGNL
ncbi:photosystem II protein [[Phormidium ambiguum] IAM M-71]|uniref:Photosystem II reaction center protein Psb30 n=1 Tax=[Phormidium ambiguum] IAM M-71 TaxID=454136 RepID=A0A1U7IRT6_9CYAN|nr:photosystem II reaction center protein Ycf12 [Phormidium ambiguum]OKH40103.1 photosystem II protein [Phormidium ambiguum IAM M-71]